MNWGNLFEIVFVFNSFFKPKSEFDGTRILKTGLFLFFTET